MSPSRLGALRVPVKSSGMLRARMNAHFSPLTTQISFARG
jgi:hypothetical protein